MVLNDRLCVGTAMIFLPVYFYAVRIKYFTDIIEMNEHLTIAYLYPQRRR
jgi:hypothetical protein